MYNTKPIIKLVDIQKTPPTPPQQPTPPTHHLYVTFWNTSIHAIRVYNQLLTSKYNINNNIMKIYK